MTLEEAQEKILDLTEQVENLTQERDSLSQNNNELTETVENLRTLNQKYFNKLIAQDTEKEHEEEEPDVPSCEDFAKDLKF